MFLIPQSKDLVRILPDVLLVADASSEIPFYVQGLLQTAIEAVCHIEDTLIVDVRQIGAQSLQFHAAPVQEKVNDGSLQFEQDPDDIGFAQTRVGGNILCNFVPIGGLAVFDLRTIVVEG
jgi:hypothetical protein